MHRTTAGPIHVNIALLVRVTHNVEHGEPPQLLVVAGHESTGLLLHSLPWCAGHVRDLPPYRSSVGHQFFLHTAAAVRTIVQLPLEAGVVVCHTRVGRLVRR